MSASWIGWWGRVRQGRGRCWVRGVLGLLVLVVLLCSCSESGSDSGRDIEHLKELSWREVHDEEVLELGVSKYFSEVGVMELLKNYLVNVPPTAEFISRFEITNSSAARRHLYSEAAAKPVLQNSFETVVLSQALSAVGSLTQSSGPQVLHDEFFQAFEECGRDSRWPDVELFELSNGKGYDLVPEVIEHNHEISYYEYQLLKHECARYAATYPNLDKSIRDELLAPQREHYARVVVDGILNQGIIVPKIYRDEWNELVKSGW